MEKSVVSTKKLSKEEAKEEPPSTIIWYWLGTSLTILLPFMLFFASRIRYYLAQHASFVGEPLRALALLDECIEHTPTCIEFEVMKARVYKDHGDVDQAVAHIEEARSMDLADRYLNNKNTRYLLRCVCLALSDGLYMVWSAHSIMFYLVLVRLRRLASSSPSTPRLFPRIWRLSTETSTTSRYLSRSFMSH